MKKQIDSLDEAEKKELAKKLSENLPVLRSTMKYTQDDLAKQLGVSRQTIISIETGKSILSWPMTMAVIMIFSSSAIALGVLKSIGFFGKSLCKALPVLGKIFDKN